MVELVKQVIDYYTKFKKTPDLSELKINEDLLSRPWNVFVTIYKNGEISGSSWNIKEIEESIALELIENTINAISKDPRFEPISIDDVEHLKIRVDEITGRRVLKEKEINTLEPMKTWVIAIKKDYETLATILPDISPLIITWDDFSWALSSKLWVTDFKESDYIIYAIETKVEKDF